MRVGSGILKRKCGVGVGAGNSDLRAEEGIYVAGARLANLGRCGRSKSKRNL